MVPPLDDMGGAKELARHRLQVAKEDLADAEHSLREERYRNANNRAYYAIFHAISACLALKFKSFKSHAQTIGYFNKEFVHTGIFPSNLAQKISHAEKVRNASDYEDFYIVDKAKTQEQVENARQIVDFVERYLEAAKV